MLSKNLFLALAIIFTSVAFLLACFNQAMVPVTFFKWHCDLPMAVIISKCYLLGVLTSFCVWMRGRKEVKVEQKKLEWKTEDAKLQTEIQSDKVHQLELQVKTLESALDKALKRSKSQ
jgi:uncharacterized integral membrane protein